MKEILRKILVFILIFESKLVLRKYKPRIVAITGSVGKTSTKDAVYAVISKVAHVRKSEKSFNSEIGLPLTILGCPNGWGSPVVWLQNIFRGLWLYIAPHKYPTWLVLEVGVGKPGDMERTASFLSSDVVIITGIGETPVHIEFFDSRKHLIEEKSGLIKTLKPDGLLILNKDDEGVLDMKEKTKNLILTYGFSEGADILGSGYSILYEGEGEHKEPTGIVFRGDVDGASLPVSIRGVFGKNHAYASLASLAVSYGMKWNMISAVEALKNYGVPPGRMRLLKGENETLIIDDTYNSSPLACKSALETLKGAEVAGRKIAVLGDMLELGRHTEEEHKKIGSIAKGSADVLVVIGPRARGIKEGALEAKMKAKNIFEFRNSVEAGEFLKDFIKKGDMILVKGSQGMRMERAVEKILKDKENKRKLLVRQSKEWLAKA